MTNITPSNGMITIKVVDSGGDQMPVRQAWIKLTSQNGRVERGAAKKADGNGAKYQRTNDDGVASFSGVSAGNYTAEFLHVCETSGPSDVTGSSGEYVLKRQLQCQVKNELMAAHDCVEVTCRGAQVGDVVQSKVDFGLRQISVIPPSGAAQLCGDDAENINSQSYSTSLSTPGRLVQVWTFSIPLVENGTNPTGVSGDAKIVIRRDTPVSVPVPTQISGQVTLNRAASEPTEDIPLWVAIRAGTEALSFNNYLAYMSSLFEGKDKRKGYRSLTKRRALPFNDTDGYRVLKAATEAFVMVNCEVLPSPDDLSEENAYIVQRGVPPIDAGAWAKYAVSEDSVGGEKMLPYLALIRSKLPDVPVISQGDDLKPGETSLCVGILQEKLAFPCLIELIWSYWMEEAGLVQTMNAVTRRFQNRRAPGAVDPLANLEIDPLRPLSNLLWGYTQDEQHRLTVNRRNHEYDHQYGLHLQGRAVQDFRPVDSRSQFLEAFHQLLRLCMVFYKQDDDTTVKADAFPVLNALKEVHLVLSQAAHNQFGDMPATARCEMLMQQWLLSRPEFREFLPSRVMVAYPEPWMDRVDAMKKLQGWTDTSVVHFRNLAKFGEQLLLSARYGHWSDVQEPAQAFNWARVFRPQIQGYAHAYRAATGVDLTDMGSNAAAFSMLPSLLMQRRMAQQARSA